jgi:peptidyl-dipeptidase Dcp
MFGTFTSTMNSKEMQKVQKEMAPLLAAYQDEVIQNEPLFKRIKALYGARDKSWTPEQTRLVETHYTNFARHGAALSKDDKAKLADINKKLASLFTTFSQNQLYDEESQWMVLDKEDDLAGLPESLRGAMKTEAEGKKLKGKWIITNTRSSAEPFLTYSQRRDLREKVWRNYVSRGDNGDAHDTKATITEILKLRAERAALLGYPTHAHWRLENSMAKTPERAMALLEAVWKPAVARVHEEVADMQAIANKEHAKGMAGESPHIEPWDYRYYAEKVRKAKYDLDENEVKPYLQLEKLREAMFWVAGELYDLHFRPAKGVPVYHPDMRVFEVEDGKGKHVALWYFKPRSKHFEGLELPPDVESLEINWANPSTLAGLRELPRLRHLEIHRCRNLTSLGELPRIAPNLERLVITTSGRLTDHAALAALPRLRLARHDGRELVVARAG